MPRKRKPGPKKKKRRLIGKGRVGQHPLSPSPDEVRARRIESGLTVTAAAALLNRTYRSWRHYEAGTRAIDPVLWRAWLIRAMLADPDTTYRRVGDLTIA
jgi:hypothetical protein